MGNSADSKEGREEQLEKALEQNDYATLSKLATSDMYSDGQIINKSILLGKTNCLTFLLDKCSTVTVRNRA